MFGGTMQPERPAKLRTSEMLNFESVNVLRNNGSGPAWSPQKNVGPNQPTPISAIFP
jgi:hypothetical protein